MARELTKENFEKEVMLAKTPVLVDFWASWCGPCKMVSPIIDRINEEYQDKLSVCKVNIDDQPGLASEYAVVSIPTILIFKNGKIVKRSVGAKSFDDFCDMIDEII